MDYTKGFMYARQTRSAGSFWVCCVNANGAFPWIAVVDDYGNLVRVDSPYGI